LNEDLERIAQERELVLPKLDRRSLGSGVLLRTLARSAGLAVVVDVRRFGQPLFYAAMEGTTPDNVELGRRKTTWWRASIAVLRGGLSLKGKTRR